MKIIGRSEGGWIVDLSTTEMSRVLNNNGKNWPAIGDTVDVAAFCEILDKVRSLDERRIQFAISRTRDMLKAFEEVKNSIDALILFDNLSRPEDENS